MWSNEARVSGPQSLSTGLRAEATETQVWLDFAFGCGDLHEERRTKLVQGYEELGKMLGAMMAHPEKFSQKPEDSHQQTEGSAQSKAKALAFASLPSAF